MAAVEFPPEVAGLLGRLRERLAARADVVGVYVYGSLVTGDYSPAASDIDVVALVRREPDQAMIGELTALHTALASTGGPAGQLHCLYVAAGAVSDPERLCVYWFGDRMTQWQLKLLTRAELASAGVALHGAWPPPGLEPVPLADLQAAVHAEVTGYWRRISRQRRLWLQATWIDHALVALPRAEALLTTGDMITKGEAIGRLTASGVPPSLAEEIRRRRDGRPVRVSPPGRLVRAVRARRAMQAGVARLSRLTPPETGGRQRGPQPAGQAPLSRPRPPAPHQRPHQPRDPGLLGHRGLESPLAIRGAAARDDGKPQARGHRRRLFL